MSTDHECPCIIIDRIDKHSNADSLGIVHVDGRPCVVRLAEWNEGDRAVYIPIDSVVPTDTGPFSFLADAKTGAFGRVRAKKLRGVFSMGLLTPAPRGAEVGQDCAAALGVTAYAPTIRYSRGREDQSGGVSAHAAPDPGFLPHYDIESLRKHSKVLHPDEEVVIHEKIHGANARFAFHQGRLWCASRTQFWKPGEGMWWDVAKEHDLEARLAKLPGIAFYGEVYGRVQDLRYGIESGARLTIFDAFNIERGEFCNHDDLVNLLGVLNNTFDAVPLLLTPPLLYRGPWGDAPADLEEGPTLLSGDHVREGYVVRPVVERWDQRVGRVILKHHGQGYLLRKGA